MVREDIRNIAIIAHVDHGKTTLVDQMLKQGGVYHENQQTVDRVMDSGAIERERGITILAKNTAVHYGKTKINIVDTPGHADFGGEVERVLKMVDGVLLLVDSFEGPMPQTRFVLKKALELKLKVLIVINKIDRPDARCEEVVGEILDLLIDLEADESTIENPILYVSARKGTATLDLDTPGTDLRPLFDAILKYIPAPEGDPDGPAQVLISTIDYSEYVGRIGVGRITRGVFKAGMNVVHTNVQTGVTSQPWRLGNLYQYDGLKRVDAEEVRMGDIVALSGAADLSIGDTVCAPECIEGLPFVKISEPTVTMTFQVNDSPFAGREGTYVTSRHLRARLMRELQTDVSLRVSDTDSTDAFEVCAEFHGRERQLPVDLFQAGLLLGVEQRPGTHEGVVGFLQQAHLLGVEPQRRTPVVNLLHTDEELVVEADLVPVRGQQGHGLLLQGLHAVVGFSGTQHAEHQFGLREHLPGIVIGKDRIFERGLVLVRGDGVDLGLVQRHAAFEGGHEMLGQDLVERRHAVRRIPFGEKRVFPGRFPGIA